MAREPRGVFAVPDLPFRLVFIMWLVFTVQFYSGIHLAGFGVRPRTVFGLTGIFFGPLIHGDLLHILSNTIPLLFLSVVLFFFYGPLARPVFLASYFFPMATAWLIGKTGTLHIGASGLVYSLVTYLIVFGVFSKRSVAVVISLAIAALYGGIYSSGLIPTELPISWEAHVGGVITGLTCALFWHFRKS